MSRRSSYQANRESVDSFDEDASFLTHAAPQAGHSQHRTQQQQQTKAINGHHDQHEYEYGQGHLREQQATSSSSTTTSGRLVSGQRGATITTTTTTTKTTNTGDEISIATLASAAIDPLSLPLTHQEALSPVSPAPAQPAPPQEPTYSKWSTIIHQLSFLGTGIFSTIAVQWLYYQGAASGSTMLTVFFNYIGMMSVGLVYAIQSWYADRKQRRLAAKAGGGRTHVEYDVLMTEVNEMTETRHNHGNQHILQGTIINDRLGRSRKSLETETHVLGPIDDSDEEDFDEEDGLDEEKQGLRKDRSSGFDEVLAMGSTNIGNSTTSAEDAKLSARRLHWPVIQVAVMDVIANAMVTVGFFYVGSGMYQVIYSSIVIWCAILTRIFLSRKLNNIQWVAIVGVTIGLAISAVGTVQDASPDGPVQSWIEKSFGALITLAATFLYACVYVLSDKVLSTTKPTPIPEKVCSMVGGYASLLTFIYLCAHTFPNWKAEVADVVADRQGSTIGILLVYPLLIISSMLHSLNYYVLLSRINNIAVGIMQSLRAVLVFVMSHYLFCGVSSTQCFNQWKFLSAIVVIGCVTLFSFNSSPSASSHGGGASGSSKTDSAQAKALAAIKASANSRTSSPIPRHRRGQTSFESP